MENNNLLHKDMFSPGVHVVWGETYSDVYDRYRALVDSPEGRSYWFHFDYDALEVKLFAFIPTNLNKTIGQLFCAAALISAFLLIRALQAGVQASKCSHQETSHRKRP